MADRLSKIAAPKGANTKKTRVGRGVGSGLGKTSGRGQKGQKARSTGLAGRLYFEGGQTPLARRLPKRGFTNARFRTEYTIINVDLLDAFADGATVDLESILAKGLTSKVSNLLKVLGDGELKKKLTVRAQKFSKIAAEKIQKAGGTTVLLDESGREAAASAS